MVLLGYPNDVLSQCDQKLPLVAEQGSRTHKPSTDPFPLSSFRPQATKARSLLSWAVLQPSWIDNNDDWKDLGRNHGVIISLQL